LKKPYIIEVEIDFDCLDDTVSGIFAEIENSETKIYVKDGRVRAVNEQLIHEGENEYLFTKKYTVIGDTVYADIDYTVNGEDNGKLGKNKAKIDGAKTTALVKELCIIGGISADDFANTMDGKSDGEHFAIYTGISERGREVLENVMKTQLEGTCDSASLLDATLTVKIDERKYDSATLLAEFGVEISGKTYPVSMCVELDFDYGESFDIYLPDDVDQYVENELDNFIG